MLYNRRRLNIFRGRFAFCKELLTTLLVSSFEKGLAGRGGWREEILLMPTDSGLFPVLFFYATLRRRGTIFAVFWALLARKAFQPEFGAYRGLARVLKSPSNPQNCRKKEKIMGKGTFIFCSKPWDEPNPGSKEI